jgi:hypothetical protein
MFGLLQFNDLIRTESKPFQTEADCSLHPASHKWKQYLLIWLTSNISEIYFKTSTGTSQKSRYAITVGNKGLPQHQKWEKCEETCGV